MSDFSLNQESVLDLDKEWIHLILQAKGIGLSIDEIRNFLISKEFDNGQSMMSGLE